MKRIDTSAISDPSIQQPFTGPTLDFMQDWTVEAIGAMIQGSIGFGYLSGIPYAVYGCEYTGSVNTPTTVNDGYIYKGGNLYRVLGGGPIATGATFVVAPVATGSIQYTDGIVRNPLITTSATLTDATLGTGTFNLSDVVYLSLPNAAQTMLNSWTGTINARKSRQGIVSLSGASFKTTPGTTVMFTLPAGMRPLVARTIPTSVLYATTGGLVTDVVQVATNGNVNISGSNAGTGNTTVYLDGIRFNVD